MGKRFPLPREALPRLDVGPEEIATNKEFMLTLLAHTVQEFETHAYKQSSVVNTKRWKPHASREDLMVHRERDSGATSKSLAAALRNFDLTHPPFNFTTTALAAPTMLVTSTGTGRMEDVMGSLLTENQADLGLVVRYMNGAASDCAILTTMEMPTKEEPYHFLGYKFFVKTSPGDGILLRHRHSLYLEFSGVTRSSTGEPLGFLVMNSVDLPQFPSLSGYKTVCMKHSTRYIFRQKSRRVVESFMMTNVDVAGALLKALSSMFFSLGGLFGVQRLLDMAEIRRLTSMARNRRLYGRRVSDAEVEGEAAILGPEACDLCRRTGKMETCPLCRQRICRRCFVHKKIFVNDPEGILGDFHKVPVCTACVMHAKTESQDQSNRWGYSECVTASISTTGDSDASRLRLGSIDASEYSLDSASHRPPASFTPSSMSQNSPDSHQQWSENSLRSQRLTKAQVASPYTSSDHVQKAIGDLEHGDLPSPVFYADSSSSGSSSNTPAAAQSGFPSQPTYVSQAYVNQTFAGATPDQLRLMAQMLEIRNMAEVTSMTTQQNGTYLAEQMQQLHLRARNDGHGVGETHK